MREPYGRLSRHIRMRLRLMILVLGLVCVASCTSRSVTAIPATATKPASAVPAGDVFSKSAAEAKANAMLAAVRLPAGAVRVGRAPTHDLDASGDDDPMSLNPEAGHRWWMLPGTTASLTAYLRAHPPKGFTVMGSTDGRVSVTTFQMLPPVATGDADNARLFVSYEQVGHRVAIKALAQVIWLNVKSAVETVPPSVRSATLDYTGSVDELEYSPPAAPARVHRVLTGSNLGRVVADLNAGTATLPIIHGCAGLFSRTFEVGLHYRGHHVTFLFDQGDCHGVQVTADGVSQQAIDLPTSLDELIQPMLGPIATPIPRELPLGPLVRTPPRRVTVLEHTHHAAATLAASMEPTPYGTEQVDAHQCPSRPAYRGLGTFVNGSACYTIFGNVSDLVSWYRAQLQWAVVAEPTPATGGVRRLVLETRDRKPLNVLTWISLTQQGNYVVFRIDNQTGWKP